MSSIRSWARFDSTRSSKWRTPAWAQITYHSFSLIHFSGRALPILNSYMKDRCGFLFVCYKRHCCTELVSWEHAACPLSGNKKRPLVGGWLNISSVVISIGATASVRYREAVCSWEGSLWEVLLYTSNSFHFFRMWLYLLFQWLWKSYCTKHLFPMREFITGTQMPDFYQKFSQTTTKSGFDLWRHYTSRSTFQLLFLFTAMTFQINC